jgi:hypothetical protein
MIEFGATRRQICRRLEAAERSLDARWRHLRTLIESIGTLIVCVATALPWLPLAAVGAWIVRWLLRRRLP